MNFSLLQKLLKHRRSRKPHKISLDTDGKRVLVERGYAYFRQEVIDKYGETLLRAINRGNCDIRAIEDYTEHSNNQDA